MLKKHKKIMFKYTYLPYNFKALQIAIYSTVNDITFFSLIGDPKTWQNKCLPGDPNYLVGANCVSVLIDHF